MVVQQRLEEIRSRGEALQNALAEEYYEVKAGLKNASDLSAIYRRFGDAVSREAIAFVRGRLEMALHPDRALLPPDVAGEPIPPGGVLLLPGVPAPAAPPAAPPAPVPPGAAGLEVRRLRSLLEFQTDEFIGAEVKAITDALLTRESAASIKVGAGSSAEEIAFRKVLLEASGTADRARREVLEQASVAVVDEWNPLLAERIGIERGIARSFGHDAYSGLWQELSGIDLVALDRQMQGFLARTEDMYREAMGWVVRKRLGISLDDARRHDLHWIFRGEEFDDWFPKTDMVAVAERSLAEMGVDIAAGGNIRFDLEPRERKAARAFCATIDVPRRIVLCLHPEGGRRDWQQLLHEVGHALHFGYTSPEEPYEFRRLGDSSLSETYAFLFQYLLIDRGWLKRNLAMSRPKEFLFLAYLEKLAYLRRYAAKLHYELELHGGENGIEGRDDRYEAAMRGALKISYPKELYLYDVDRAFYVARYLRAWLFEGLLSKHLVHYFDEDWWRNPRTGAFLKKHWRIGQQLGVEEMAKEIGYGGLDTTAIETELAKAL